MIFDRKVDRINRLLNGVRNTFLNASGGPRQWGESLYIMDEKVCKASTEILDDIIKRLENFKYNDFQPNLNPNFKDEVTF